MRLGACLIAAAILGGCAAHRPAGGSQTASVDRVIDAARLRPAPTPPPRTDAAATLEHSDAELSAARLLLSVEPTPENQRRVARAYARLGVLDLAFDHFDRALQQVPHDAASFDGRARIWRDWGFPAVGLADAYRAVYFAPQSPAAQNTLGTLLLNTGHFAEATARFERALVLEPGAAYALNNLCYTSLMQGDRVRAVGACKGALAAQPDMRAARNNLGLVYAASGDFTSASAEFSRSGSGPSAERYNMGIALSATGRYAAAARAFDESSVLLPSAVARQRAKLARSLASRSEIEEAHGANR